MNKKAVAILVAILILTFAFSVAAQQPKKVLWIRFLGTTASSPNAARIVAFAQGLRKLGFRIGIKEKEYSYG